MSAQAMSMSVSMSESMAVSKSMSESKSKMMLESESESMAVSKSESKMMFESESKSRSNIRVLRILSAADFALFLALVATGCGRPFKVDTALRDSSSSRGKASTRTAQRLPTALSSPFVSSRTKTARTSTSGRKPCCLQMRDVSGYALLASRDVASLDGTKGKEMRFGHDEDKKPYEYIVQLFTAQGRVFVVEAGGTQEQMKRAQPSIDWTMKSVKVKCDTLVSPVLASRTCNRW